MGFLGATAPKQGFGGVPHFPFFLKIARKDGEPIAVAH